MLHVSGAAARRFLVARHRVIGPAARAGAGRPGAVLPVVAHLGGLQFDPLESPGARNHELVLHARAPGYRRGYCERWLYGRARRLFEAWNKALSILPLDELPYHRVIWDAAAARHGSLLDRHAAEVRHILARIAAEGPLATAAFTREPALARAVPWGWAPARLGRVLVESLFLAGRLAIARREGPTRYFDLPERLFPAASLARRVTPAEAQRHRALTRFRAVGLLGASGAPEVHAGLGSAAERRHTMEALAAAGELVEVAVDGVRGPRWVLAGERALLDDPPAAPGAVTFLAPLDPLLWDRRLVEELFGFAYRWEVYTPVARRRHGYYVLPVLHGDRLVARIELRLDRARDVLDVLVLTREPGFRGGHGWRAALDEALEAYRGFVGAGRLAFAPAAARAR
jgi:uncharacterized protein YcaQ